MKRKIKNKNISISFFSFFFLNNLTSSVLDVFDLHIRNISVVIERAKNIRIEKISITYRALLSPCVIVMGQW